MSKKTNFIQIVLTTGIILLTIAGLSGCTSNTTKNNDKDGKISTLIGTWVGTLQMPLFGGSSNATVSQITFTSNRTEIVFSRAGRTMLMNYTYTITSDAIVLTPVMIGRNRFAGQGPFNGTFPQNGTRPPGNGTWSPNGTQPPGNGTWPPNGMNPYNGTWPSDGTRPPGDNRPSMTVSFSYAVDEEATVLFLNNVQFKKVQ